MGCAYSTTVDLKNAASGSHGLPHDGRLPHGSEYACDDGSSFKSKGSVSTKDVDVNSNVLENEEDEDEALYGPMIAGYEAAIQTLFDLLDSDDDGLIDADSEDVRAVFRIVPMIITGESSAVSRPEGMIDLAAFMRYVADVAYARRDAKQETHRGSRRIRAEAQMPIVISRIKERAYFVQWRRRMAQDDIAGATHEHEFAGT